MTLRTLATALLAVSLTVPAAHAQTSTTGAAQPAANAVDPASIQALKDMGAYLQTLNRFEASTTLTGERVLSDGEKLQHMASATVYAERPNKLRAHLWSARSERDLIYDGKTFTMYLPREKYYSTVEFSEPISGLVNKLEDRYGIEIPMADLFKWGTAAAPTDKIESAMNAGQDFVGDDLCDHYAFRQGRFDWQIWIMTGAQSLPRKLVITNRADEARPQSVSIIDWNLRPVFDKATFKFTPPVDASRIEMVPLKAK